MLKAKLKVLLSLKVFDAKSDVDVMIADEKDYLNDLRCHHSRRARTPLRKVSCEAEAESRQCSHSADVAADARPWASDCTCKDFNVILFLDVVF